MEDKANNEAARDSIEVCAVCGTKKALQRCSGCNKVFYCSREHQKRHWKEHSKKCRSFKLAVDSKLGRHYVASRKINADEIIIKEEEPLIAGPMHGSVPVCLSCYVVLNATTAVPCEKCGWPLCSNCTVHGPECEFTIRRKGSKVSITDYGFPHPTYRSICVIRALCLRESNPERYRKLLELEDHCDLVTRQAELAFEKPLEVARFVKKFFKIDDVLEDEIARIIGILQVNGHEVPTTEPPHVAVYDTASFFEHHCRANCSKSFTNGGGLVVRAAIPIAKGDHISICYTDSLWGLNNRRYHLAQSKFFDCMCERCQDPTEFGTMFNAIRCTKRDCTGYMLPRTFLYQHPIPPDYICDKCQATSSWEQVERTLEKIGIELANMKKNDIKTCKEFISRYADTLHENHFYNTDVKLTLAQIIGQDAGGLSVVSDELLNEKIHLCRTLVELFKNLVPAENRIRGILLFELHAAIAECGRRKGRQELRGMLMESKKHLIEAYRLLRYEPSTLPEGQIAIRAHRNLQEMAVIFNALSLDSSVQLQDNFSCFESFLKGGT